MGCVRYFVLWQFEQQRLHKAKTFLSVVMWLFFFSFFFLMFCGVAWWNFYVNYFLFIQYWTAKVNLGRFWCRWCRIKSGEMRTVKSFKEVCVFSDMTLYYFFFLPHMVTLLFMWCITKNKTKNSIFLKCLNLQNICNYVNVTFNPQV